MSREEKMPWLEMALCEVASGVSEVPGLKHNPRIVEYHSTTTLKATSDEVPWCSSFVCWAMERSGIRSSKSAMARSWLKWGKPLDQPRLGCIVVLARGVPGSNQGHVGFYCGRNISSLAILGGNQSDRVSIEYFHRDRVIGLRWPSEGEP